VIHPALRMDNVRDSNFAQCHFACIKHNFLNKKTLGDYSKGFDLRFLFPSPSSAFNSSRILKAPWLYEYKSNQKKRITKPIVKFIFSPRLAGKFKTNLVNSSQLDLLIKVKTPYPFL
jgi:hypothetical protein